MPPKPNYRFERAERERLKAERKAKKAARRASLAGEADPSAAGDTAIPPDDAPGRESN